MNEFERRFGGIERLYGSEQTSAICKLHIAVIGLGGVGSWAAEALARSGVGEITLIDMDDVCLSNINRQSHALTSTVGELKTEVITERLKQINPEIKVHVVDDFITPENIAQCLSGTEPNSESEAESRGRVDGVLDAIDSIKAKTALLAWCKRNKLPVVTTGGAGGQIDPTQIRIADVARVKQDPLMAKVRNQLRRDFNFSTNPKRKFGIDCVYSEEQLRYPTSDGNVSYAKPGSEAMRLDCSTGFGASMMVTASFGLFAAAQLLKRVLPKYVPES